MSSSDLKVELPPTGVDVPVVAIPEKLPMSRARRQKLAAAKTVESKASGQPQPSSSLPPASTASRGSIASAKIPPQSQPDAKNEPAHESNAPNESDDDETSSPASPTGKSSLYRFLSATPSWLISAVVHLGAILLLALYVVTSKEKPTTYYVLSSPIEEAEPLLYEPTKFVHEIQNTTEMSGNSPSSEALGFTDLGNMTDTPSSTMALGAGELTTSPVGDIGDVFGGKGKGMSSTGVNAHSAEFFGVKATGRKFVFIVDSSNSMRAGKFDDAKKELMYALARLNKDQFFYIIFFDHDAERMRMYPNTEPEEKAVRATTENIKRVEQWVNTVENERKTDPSAAVKFAVEMLPDAIYLLSDGIFTDRGQTVRYLKEKNFLDDPIDGYRPKVVIHTVGFYSQDGEENLKSIAKTYGGTYRFVPKPIKKK